MNKIIQHADKWIYGYIFGMGMLGFKRGSREYTYSLERMKERKGDKDIQNFFYSTNFVEGLKGSFFYILPPTALFMLTKEIYRMEVNIRNLEDEKKSDFYNKLF